MLVLSFAIIFWCFGQCSDTCYKLSDPCVSQVDFSTVRD